MIASEKSGDSKAKIRNRYKGVDPSELEVIPAISMSRGELREEETAF